VANFRAGGNAGGEDCARVGAHTQTHPSSAPLSDDAARAEVVGSKEWLEDVLDQPVTAFSYGGSHHYGRSAVEIVGAAGFELACSGEVGPVDRSSDPLQLPRMMVETWTATTSRGGSLSSQQVAGAGDVSADLAQGRKSRFR
jgi:peptidoglycan/xylan/chitin deacetylase (PgdA/CDA1 family)